MTTILQILIMCVGTFVITFCYSLIIQAIHEHRWKKFVRNTIPLDTTNFVLRIDGVDYTISHQRAEKDIKDAYNKHFKNKQCADS